MCPKTAIFANSILTTDFEYPSFDLLSIPFLKILSPTLTQTFH